MIYGVIRNKGECNCYLEDELIKRIYTLEKPKNSPYVDCVKK